LQYGFIFQYSSTVYLSFLIDISFPNILVAGGEFGLFKEASLEECVSVCYIGISFIYIIIISGMKAELDDSNYEAMISKLAKGSMEDKAASLKKLLFLY
jgi:hypothetical protein